MSLWAIVIKGAHEELDWCDPVETDSAEQALAIAMAEPRHADDEERPELEAIPEADRQLTRPVFALTDAGLAYALGRSSTGRMPKFMARLRKAKPRKPRKRWS